MFGIFASFLFVKAIIISIIAIWGKLHVALIIFMIIGTIFEGIASILLEESKKLVVKEVMYYGGILLQIICIFIMTIPLFSLPKEDINFIMAVAIGLVGIITVSGWFANGFGGLGFHFLYYGIMFIFFIIEGILYAILKSYILLILNTVVACISIIVIFFARIIKGSNLE